jgi:outer membrane protein assembly factor BamB
VAVQAVITLGGQEVNGATGVARHPGTGVLYVLLKIGSPQTSSLLATLDERSGVATSVGTTGQRMSTMTFASDGTLYAASGNMSVIAHGLFTVDTSTGQSTLIGNLSNGGDEGEALAYNPEDGLLYHAKGLGARNNNNSGEIFEKFDPATCTGLPDLDCDFTQIDLFGSEYEELSALVYVDGGFFAADVGDTVDDPHFYRITTFVNNTALVAVLGPMDHIAKGFVPLQPAVPTLSAPMLAVLVAALLVLGFFGLARPPRAVQS